MFFNGCVIYFIDKRKTFVENEKKWGKVFYKKESGTDIRKRL